MHQLKAIEFNGDQLQYITKDGEHWFPLTLLCDLLELDANAQQQRLRDEERTPWTCACVTHVQVQVSGQGRDVFCINLDGLAMWLATIDSSRVAPGSRDKVIDYQRRCPRALREAFFGPAPGRSAQAYARIGASFAGFLAAAAAELGFGPERFVASLNKAGAAAVRAMAMGSPERVRRGAAVHEATIRAWIEANPGASASRCLRELRATGHGMKQDLFWTLFAAIRNGGGGTQ